MTGNNHKHFQYYFAELTKTAITVTVNFKGLRCWVPEEQTPKLKLFLITPTTQPHAAQNAVEALKHFHPIGFLVAQRKIAVVAVPLAATPFHAPNSE